MPVLSPPAHRQCLPELVHLTSREGAGSRSVPTMMLPVNPPASAAFLKSAASAHHRAPCRRPETLPRLKGPDERHLDSLQGCITVCIRAFGSANWTVQCGLTIADAGRDWRQIDSHIGSLSLRDPKAPCPFGGRTRSTAFCIGRQRRSGDHFHLTKSSWGDPHYGKEVRYQC